MSQKELIESMLDQKQGYDEIEDQTGSNRSYIRSIAVGYRNRQKQDETEEPDERESETPTPEPETIRSPGMSFIDDTSPLEEKSRSKTGGEYHREWVKAAKYECGTCGATIGRSTSFCPHCGKTMEWEGIE